MKIVRTLFIIILFSCAGLPTTNAQKDALTALYFFSPTCPQCKNTAPFIKELGREFTIQGFVFGNGKPEPMPFKVKTADKETLLRFNVRQFPTLVVMMNDTVKQTIVGEQDIKNAGVMLQAFRKGALSVSEVVTKKPEETFVVTGWVVSRGEYFRDAKFFLTDRRETVSLRPWLPLETARSPWRSSRPRMMSDVINRPVVLEGALLKTGNDPQFTVNKELSFE